VRKETEHFKYFKKANHIMEEGEESENASMPQQWAGYRPTDANIPILPSRAALLNYFSTNNQFSNTRMPDESMIPDFTTEISQTQPRRRDVILTGYFILGLVRIFVNGRGQDHLHDLQVSNAVIRFIHDIRDDFPNSYKLYVLTSALLHLSWWLVPEDTQKRRGQASRVAHLTSVMSIAMSSPEPEFRTEAHAFQRGDLQNIVNSSNKKEQFGNFLLELERHGVDIGISGNYVTRTLKEIEAHYRIYTRHFAEQTIHPAVAFVVRLNCFRQIAILDQFYTLHHPT
jgi:hypothetical protein